MINKILCIIALGVMSGLATAGAQPSTPASARVKGQIVAARVQGQVTALSKATLDNRLLHDGDAVSDQTTIVTGPGASVILVFSNGATVDLGANSKLNISDFEQDPFSGDVNAADLRQEPGTSATKLNLTKGELTARVAHLNLDKGSEFTIQTPVGAAGIRGTFLKVILQPLPNHKARFSIETQEGLVEFTGLTTGPVLIPAGHKFEATFDYNPKDVDDPIDWLPPSSLTLEDIFISPGEAAQFQRDLQAILGALGTIVFHPGPGNGGGAGSGNAGGLNPPAPPPPAPPPNPLTPGAGSGS